MFKEISTKRKIIKEKIEEYKIPNDKIDAIKDGADYVNENNKDGLVHISDLSWHKKIKHPAEFTKVDASLDVIVLDIDQKNRKISLGHKQTEENPWDKHEQIYLVGKEFDGIGHDIGEIILWNKNFSLKVYLIILA